MLVFQWSSWYPPRLKEVAARAQVSVATASRVLTGAVIVDASKAAAVRQAAQELGYRHSISREQGFIVVLVAGLERWGYASTLTGVQAEAREHGLLVELALVDGPTQQSSDWLDRILCRSFVGVVAVEFDSAAVQIIESFPASVPCVIAGGSLDISRPDRKQCLIDDRVGARDATERLLALGHQQVHYLGVPQAGHPEPRLLGWQDALQAAHLPKVPPLGVGWSGSTGFRVGRAIAHRDVTAVLCGNDELALGVMRGLMTQGVDVPGDVSVVGFDAHPIGEFTNPPLTTVRQDFELLGRTAVRLLLDDARPGEAKILGTEYVGRGSTAPPGRSSGRKMP